MSLSIVMFAQDYIPNIGGIAVHVHNLSASLVKAGCSVQVISTSKDIKGRNLTKWRSQRKVVDGVDILEIPVLNFPKNVFYGLQLKYRFARVVIKEIKKRKAGIFHWHNINFDPEIAKHVAKTGVRMIFTNHSSQFLQGMMNAKELEYNKKNLSYADYVITPSTELKDETVKCGVDGNKIFFISNGVNTQEFSPDENQRKLYRKDLGLTDEVSVICPRRVVPKCGVVYLAKALKHLKTKRKVKIFFTGLVGGDMTWRDIAYEAEVKKNLTAFNDNIVVVALPQIANTEMINYYRAMDICVLPSLVEATSISGLEAMATELAIIGTNVGGIPELINNTENGLLVEKANEVALAEAMDKLFEDDVLRKTLAANARKTAVEKFDWSMIAKEVIQVYNKN